MSRLPAGALREAGVEERAHSIRDVLLGAEDAPKVVYFPQPGAVTSIVRSTATGQMVETAIVGNEGLFHVQAALAPPEPTGSEAVVQNDGRIARMEVTKLRELFDAYPPFRQAVLGYTSVYLDQVTQNLVCNRLHAIEQRMAKWLLVMRDRVHRDELHLTQEFLSHMLGVHRPGVSIAVSALESDGLIRHRRNWIELRDREGVEARSCECYAALRRKLHDFTMRFD